MTISEKYFHALINLLNKYSVKSCTFWKDAKVNGFRIKFYASKHRALNLIPQITDEFPHKFAEIFFYPRVLPPPPSLNPTQSPTLWKYFEKEFQHANWMEGIFTFRCMQTYTHTYFVCKQVELCRMFPTFFTIKF